MMTVGFERSLLERKDRDELSQIAESLGEKPLARAKKADIVDLILRLAGVTTDAPEATTEAPAAANGSGEAAGDGAGDAAKPKRARAKKAVTPAADEAPEATTEAATDDTDTTEAVEAVAAEAVPAEAVAAEAAHPAPAAVTSERPARDDRPTGGPGRPDAPAPRPGPNQQQNGGQHNGGQQHTGQQNGGQQHNGGQHNGGQQNGGQQNGGVDLGEDEPGNRRRRRRGRDRERPAGAPTGAAPAPGQPGEEVFVGEPVDVEGLLDLRDEGYGFLRLAGYLPSKDDVYVSVKQVRQFALRKGDALKGAARPATRNEKNPALLRIDSVNGADPDLAKDRARFDDLTPESPTDRLALEMAAEPEATAARVIDLLAPIGKGQRGLIVAPPKAGKTTVLKQVIRGLETNHPDVHVIVVLIDERPEEVTAMRRWVQKGEVAASTFDRPADEHIQVAELVLERAKRLVEDGQDVAIVLDGLSRLARAYGAAEGASLFPAKRFFGAARKVEGAGSLTILATATVGTNSGVDDRVYEEFQGTGNMELRLDRTLAERRVFPAVDIEGSSTRHEDLLFEPDQLDAVWKLRRLLQAAAGEGESGSAALELLKARLDAFPSNSALLADVAKSS